MACLTDYKKLFKKMRTWALLTAILGVLTYCFVTLIQGKVLQYMVYSYFLLLPICVCFEYANMSKTKFDFFVALIASASMIACGARGAAVSLLLYFVVCLFRNDFRRLRIGQIAKLFFLFGALSVVILYYNELLNIIVSLFESLNIDSRTIRYLQEGNFLEDSGRQSISATVIRGLLANPLGYGLYGDRYVTGFFGSGKYRYAHNFFLEIWCDFGIIGGTILIALIAFILIKLIVSVMGKKEIHLVFALIPYALFQLLFSSSYLENIPFFALVGLAIWGTNRKNIEDRW
jgi:O-antigen ligase